MPHYGKAKLALSLPPAEPTFEKSLVFEWLHLYVQPPVGWLVAEFHAISPHTELEAVLHCYILEKQTLVNYINLYLMLRVIIY